MSPSDGEGNGMSDDKWHRTPPKDRKGRLFYVIEPASSAEHRLIEAIGGVVWPHEYLAHWSRGAWRDFRTGQRLRPSLWFELPEPPEDA